MALFPGWGDGGRAAGWRPSSSSCWGLTITAGLVVLAQKAYADNEDRLVRQRVEEVTAVLTAAIPSIQAPLATTAEVVEEESGTDLFIPVMESQVDEEGQPFVAGALFAVDEPEPVESGSAAPALLERDEQEIEAFLDRSASAAGMMSVLDLLDDEEPRLGYGYAAAGRLGPVRRLRRAGLAAEPHPGGAARLGVRQHRLRPVPRTAGGIAELAAGEHR